MAKPLENLRAWLRQTPQPHKLLVRTDTDQEHTVELSPNARNRWKNAEESVRSLNAVSVACLGKDGEVLRSHMLDPDSDPSDPGASDEAKRRRYEESLRAGDRKELALILDRYGDRLNEAFERGAAAAAVSQENLVGLVDTLTGQFATALMNLQQLSINLSQALTSGEGTEGGGGTGDLIGKLLMARMGMGVGAAAAQAPPNGKKRKED